MGCSPSLPPVKTAPASVDVERHEARIDGALRSSARGAGAQAGRAAWGALRRAPSGAPMMWNPDGLECLKR
jgi:hypothetical protein